jgi:hypothetical protein
MHNKNGDSVSTCVYTLWRLLNDDQSCLVAVTVFLVMVEGPAAETGRGDTCALSVPRVISVTRVAPLLEPGSSMQRQH